MLTQKQQWKVQRLSARAKKCGNKRHASWHVYTSWVLLYFLSEGEQLSQQTRKAVMNTKLKVKAVLNPFTASACKISGAEWCTDEPANSIFSCSLTSVFNAMCFDGDPFTCQRKKEKQKGLKVSNFALLWVIFNWPHGSEGLKIAWSCSVKQLRPLRQDLTKVFLCWGYRASQAGWSMLMKLTADWLVSSSDVIGPLWGVSTCREWKKTLPSLRIKDCFIAQMEHQQLLRDPPDALQWQTAKDLGMDNLLFDY